MTARILVSLGAIAIIAAAAVILTYQRVQPTPGEIEARNLSAMATAALNQAQASAEAAAAPARSEAMTVLIWGIIISTLALTAGVTIWLNVYLAWRSRIHVRAIHETGTAVPAPGNPLAVIAPLTPPPPATQGGQHAIATTPPKRKEPT